MKTVCSIVIRTTAIETMQEKRESLVGLPQQITSAKANVICLEKETGGTS